MSIFRDWRGQQSWGRACAAVALVVAVWREFTGADLRHVALWLGVATGSYGTSKLTEIVAFLKNVGAAAPPPPGVDSPGLTTASGSASSADRGNL